MMNVEPAVINKRHNREILRKEVEAILIGNTSQHFIDEWNRDPDMKRVKMVPLDRWIVDEPLPIDELKILQSQVDSLRANKVFLTIGNAKCVIHEDVASQLRNIGQR